MYFSVRIRLNRHGPTARNGKVEEWIKTKENNYLRIINLRWWWWQLNQHDCVWYKLDSSYQNFYSFHFTNVRSVEEFRPFFVSIYFSLGQSEWQKQKNINRMNLQACEPSPFSYFAFNERERRRHGKNKVARDRNAINLSCTKRKRRCCGCWWCWRGSEATALMPVINFHYIFFFFSFCLFHSRVFVPCDGASVFRSAWKNGAWDEGRRIFKYSKSFAK